MQKEKQVRINFYTNVITLFANFGIGLFYTPFLVNSLGVAAYGVLPLALLINQYISVVTGSLTSAFSRFYSIAVQQKEYDKASEVISTAFVVILFLSIVLLPVIFIVISRVDIIFDIPLFLVRGTKYLFILTIISFFLSLITSLLNVVLYALNRLDMMNFVKIARNSLKFVFVLLFFSLKNVDIFYVGLSNALSELLVLFLSILLFKKFSELKTAINLKKCNKILLFAIGEMTFWTIIHQLGDIGYYRIDNIIVNKYFGISYSGALGAITELGSYITVAVSVISSLFSPLLLIEYANHNHKEIQRIALSQSYIVGSLTSIIVGVIAGYSASILHVWLGASFKEFEKWLVIKMIALPYCAAGSILVHVYAVWNKVKVPALGTFLGGLICLVISLLVISTAFGSVEIILIISVIFAIILCYFFRGYCVNRIYRGNFLRLVVSFIKISVIFIGTYGICTLVQKIFVIADAVSLIIALFSSTVIIFLLIFLFFYNKDIRKQILALFIKRGLS